MGHQQFLIEILKTFQIWSLKETSLKSTITTYKVSAIIWPTIDKEKTRTLSAQGKISILLPVIITAHSVIRRMLECKGICHGKNSRWCRIREWMRQFNSSATTQIYKILCSTWTWLYWPPGELAFQWAARLT